MTFSLKSMRVTLIVALACISVMGYLLHGRVHPLYSVAEKTITNADGTTAKVKEETFVPRDLIPAVSGLVAIFLVTFLFCFKSTAAYAYLITGMSVIIGSVTMAHFSYVHFVPPFSFLRLIFNTLLGDIILLIGKFFVAKAIFDSYFIKEQPVAEK